MADLPHRLLDTMEPKTREQLSEDVRRWGAALLGRRLLDVADAIDGGRTPSGSTSKRAERLHAWLGRHGTADPTAGGAPPAPEPSALGDDDLAIARWGDEPKSSPGFDVVRNDGEEEEPIEAVLARAEASFKEKARRTAALRTPRRIRMPPGPYAIAHFGDDHLDDDGCDVASYRAAVRIVAQTPHFYAGAVGDILNNWPRTGRLTQEHADQHTTADDGWRLARWSMQSLRWCYRVLGNHDLWNNGAVILKLLAEGCQIGLLAPHEAKLELESPGVARPLRLHVRHDFKGHSMWNPAHGPMRASKLDNWGDIFISGHRHEWVTHVEEGPDNGVRWALRARGFKRFDEYALEQQFSDQRHGQVVCTVVDPGHPHPFERVRIHLDVAEAAEHLGWLRRRRA
jgi:hypothetical protein